MSSDDLMKRGLPFISAAVLTLSAAGPAVADDSREPNRQSRPACSAGIGDASATLHNTQP